MANTKLCTKCARGSPKDCIGRWQAPSVGKRLTGSQPRQSSYSYKCPKRGRGQ